MPATSQAQQRMMAISAEYAAGFFDGEGHVTIRRSNRTLVATPSYNCCVGATNTNPRVLLLLQEQYGGKIYTKARHNPIHKPALEWFLGKRPDVIKFLNSIRPFLQMKGPQVDLCLDFLRLGKTKMVVVEHRRIHPSKGGTHPVLKAAPGEIEKRETFKIELGKLNARGVQCPQ